MTNSTQPQPSVFRRFITPPVYPDEDKTRAARVLHAILLIMWVIVILSAIPTVVLAGDKLVSLLIWIPDL